MGPEQDSFHHLGRQPVVDHKKGNVSDKDVCRSGIDIEQDLKRLMTEYLEYTKRVRHISFQGGISEMAWEVENDPE